MANKQNSVASARASSASGSSHTERERTPPPATEPRHAGDSTPSASPGRESAHTPGGIVAGVRPFEPDEVDLPDSVFDELEENGGARRRLTLINKVSVQELDPIVLNAVTAVRSTYDEDADANEELLSGKYFSVAEAVTERINRRQLRPVTRLLLSQRSIYLARLVQAINAAEAASVTGNGTHHHAPDESASSASR